MRIVLPVIVAAALAIYALIDCAQTDRDRMRSLSKPVWLLIILVPILGPVAWLLLGRPKGSGRASRPAPRPRPVAPDDDPEFLRQIRNLDEEHEKMLREWEDNLRKREEGLRDDGSAGNGSGGTDGEGPASHRDEADRRPGPETDPSDGDSR